MNFHLGEKINIIEKLLTVVSPNNFDITKFVRANFMVLQLILSFLAYMKMYKLLKIIKLITKK